MCVCVCVVGGEGGGQVLVHTLLDLDVDFVLTMVQGVT